MTFVQLEYLVAVDTYRHFAQAAEHCFVTQPTLSMQLKKLEDELGVLLFDRSKQPVIPTEAGIEIIAQAKKILAEKSLIADIVHSRKGMIAGELKLGIIPTLAPYLLPLFIHQFIRKYKNVKLVVTELTTGNIITRLKDGRLDAGILVTPLQEAGISEHVLFYEEMMVYASPQNDMYGKKYVLAKDIDPNKLWLLEEGHCVRSQIMNLCELQKESKSIHRFEYEAGSIDTLRRMVDISDGITIIPEIATISFNKKQEQCLRHFKSPIPMREVSLAVHRDFVKKRLVDILTKEILNGVPQKIKQNKTKRVVPI